MRRSAGGRAPNYSTTTNEWNFPVQLAGWSTGGAMNTARKTLAGPGSGGTSNTSSLAFGGESPPNVTAATEEFNDPNVLTKTITTS